MRKLILFLCLVAVSLQIQAQITNYDTLREFPFYNVESGDISPSGNIILTKFSGEIYHANKINKIVNNVRNMFNYDEVDTIDGVGNRFGLKVKFFNADTAIIAGSIYSLGKKQQDTSGHYFTTDTSYYYLSFDGGRTLQLKTLAITEDYHEWINDIYINSKGECWMCSGVGDIWYSNDYGQSFKLLNAIIYDETKDKEDKTFDDWFDRVSLDAIAMKNSNEGIVSYLFYEDYKNKEWIFYTKDNWKTYNIWKDTNDVAPWSEQYDTTAPYILNYRGMYKKNNGNEEQLYLYCNEKIQRPDNIKWGIIKNIGYNYHNALFSEEIKDGHDSGVWVREIRLPHNIESARFYNDTTVLIWDGYDSYLYSLTSKQLKPYRYKHPLQSFLKYDIESITIDNGTAYCMTYQIDSLTFSAKNDSLYCNTMYSHNMLVIENDKNLKDTAYTNLVSAKELKKILKNINLNYNRIPTKSEFTLSEQAQEKYNFSIKSFIEDFERYATSKDRPYIQYLENFSAKTFDTLSETTFKDFIQSMNYRLHRGWLRFKITNTNNEEIRFRISAMHIGEFSPYLLPVMMEINDGKDKMLIYSVELSQYIRKCIPQITDKFFDEGYFLLRLAKYLYDYNL